MSLFAAVLMLSTLGGLGQQIPTPNFSPYQFAKGETFSGTVSAKANVVLTGDWTYSCPTLPSPKRIKKTKKVRRGGQQ